MSHPSTDPAVTAVTARLVGLDVANPAQAGILEIGCAAGHNLLPLAARWPESSFTGIDFSKPAIQEARETAKIAGLTNVEFFETDLCDFNPNTESRYDFIIAHGVYSWVPEAVRNALLEFCDENLSSAGVAVISYNVLPGWSLRRSLVELTKLVSKSPTSETIGNSPEEILGFLATATGNHTPYARHLTAVLHDMFGKGDEILPFDDFSPVNEPCTFQHFTHHASQHRLRYLSESQLAENFPSSLAPEATEILQPLAGDPFALQQMIDVLTNRTFRSALLCRSDVPLLEKISTDTVLQFSIRCPYRIECIPSEVRLVGHSGEELAEFRDPTALAFFSALSQTMPQSIPAREILERMGNFIQTADRLSVLAHLIMNSARKGLILLRGEATRFDAAVPEFPNLGLLRLAAARRGHALVDIYHSSCRFERGHQQIALAMDGSRSVAELEAISKSILPKLDFQSWLGHLAARGMIADPIPLTRN